MEEIYNKLVEYFENGSRLVWVINSQEKYVLVYRSSQEPDCLLKSADSLDREDIENLNLIDLLNKMSV